MTDSPVLDTILGLIFLFYALALLCGGLVEMIANWVKKRAKYLLRGIRDLLDDVVQAETAMPDKKGWMQGTAETGRFPLVVANPGVKGFGCPGMHITRCRRRSSAATSS
jgi:hypothetical protein